jgi:hypothetical protein
MEMIMGMAHGMSHESSGFAPRFVACECGYNGFEHEGDANRFNLRKQAFGNKMGKLKCPVGTKWHTTDLDIKSVQAFTAMVTRAPRPASTPFNSALADQILKVAPVVAPVAAKAPDELPRRDPLPRPPMPPTPPQALVKVERVAKEEPEAPPRPRPRVVDPPESEPMTINGGGSRSCVKIGYGSEALAKAMIVIAQRQGTDVKRAYKCPDCGKWHLTSLETPPDGTISHVEILTFNQNGKPVSVLLGRWSNGKVAQVRITQDGASVSIHATNANVLGAALAFVLGEVATSGASEAEGEAVASAENEEDEPARRGSRLSPMTRDRIVEAVRADPGLDAEEIAERAGLARTSVQSVVVELVREGRLLRKGAPRKGGRPGRHKYIYEVAS